MESPAWVKLALRFDGAGGAESFDLTDALPQRDHPLWVHLDYTFDESRAWLERQPEVPDAVVEALLALETRPRAVEVGGGLLVCLRGVNLYPDARPEDMIAVRLWIHGTLIISTQKRQLFTLTEISDDLEKGEGPSGPSEWLMRLVDGLVWRTEDVIERIEDQVGEFAEQLDQHPDRTLSGQIGALRRRSVTLRRYLAPQREAIMRLHGETRLERDHGEVIREAGDRLQRLLEDLDVARDHATLLQEELFAIQNEAINDRMYLIAVFSAVFLPLGFLTGLFGINVGGLPGVDDPMGFWWFMAGISVTATGIVIWMLSRRWL